MAKPTSELTPLPRGSEVVHPFSRFAGQPLYIDGGTKFWGTWAPVNIPPHPADFYFTVTEAVEGRLDLIAYRYYRTPELWWVIAEANNLFFPFEDVAVGTVLRIPSLTSITSLGLIR